MQPGLAGDIAAEIANLSRTETLREHGRRRTRARHGQPQTQQMAAIIRLGQSVNPVRSCSCERL